MAFKIGSSLYTNQGGSSTVITDTGEAKGNLSGRVGNIILSSSGPSIEKARVDLSSGNLFNYYPTYGSGYTSVLFEFDNANLTSKSPIKNYEFYLFWHNYKDSWNSGASWSYLQTPPPYTYAQSVRFPNGETTLNNSTSGLLDGTTQVFKFTTTSGGDSLSTPGFSYPHWHGTLYMRNCR